MSVSARRAPPPSFDPIDASPPVQIPPASQAQVPLFRTLVASQATHGQRRTIALAIAVALVLHALLIVIAIWFDVPSRLQQLAFPEEQITVFQIEPEGLAASSPPALEYHPETVRPLAEATATPAPVPAQTYAPPRRPAARFPEPTNPGEPERPGSSTGGSSGARGLTPGEKLHPQLIDPRLWAAPDEILGGPIDEEGRMRARVYSRLEEMNDSMAVINEARRKANDWTIKDKNGGKWGIDPKGIHLGKLTLPAPLLKPPADQRAEIERNAANWRELNTQEDRARLHSTFNDRVKAIRERKDKERGAKPSESKPAPAPKPDDKKTEKPIT
jgi:hypothetical protein